LTHDCACAFPARHANNTFATFVPRVPPIFKANTFNPV
jgi:hypothetical protein